MRNSYQYNRPIIIEKYTGGIDAEYNQENRVDDDNWSSTWTGFCREVARGSSEFFRTARLDSRIERVFKIRWNPSAEGISSVDYRVRFEGKKFYLTGVPEDDASTDRELSITCAHWVEAE